jgi:hypothetical protein
MQFQTNGQNNFLPDDRFAVVNKSDVFTAEDTEVWELEEWMGMVQPNTGNPLSMAK